MTTINWTNETIRLGDLKPWERNPRYSTEDDAQGIVESYGLFGQSDVFCIDLESNVLNGHQRLSAWLAEFGADFKVDVRRADKVFDEAEKQAFTAMMHAKAVGNWDFDAIANWGWDVDELASFGFDDNLAKTWHDDAFSLEGLIATEEEPKEAPEPQIDKAEELRQKWGVELGQLWQLGEHRIVCGDCTDPAVVERVMGGEKADGMITDPPYGVKKAEWDDIFPSLDVWEIHKAHLKNGANILVFPGEINLPYKTSVLFDVFEYQWPVIWYKPNAMQFGKTGYTVQNIAWWLSIGKPTNNPKCRDVIVDAIVPKNNDFGHPSPKNINVIEQLVKEFGGKILYEPYSGSGTTIIACENLSRRCRAAEIDPGYIAVSLQRWADHTGQTPVLIK